MKTRTLQLCVFFWSCWFIPAFATDAEDASAQIEWLNVPEIPAGLNDTLQRFHNTRSTLFAGWSRDSRNIYVKTRIDGVNQIHRVTKPRRAPEPLTSRREPVGEMAVQPGGDLIAYSMDQGGSGFDHIFLFDPNDRTTRRLTDGRSLNNRLAWDRSGQKIAFRSTRRNGRQNDIWLMDIETPDQARLVLKASDGALWKPVDFSPDGQILLVQHYASITDSRIYLLDLKTSALTLLAGNLEQPTSNVAAGFSADGKAVLFVTNQRGGSAEAGRAPLDPQLPVTYMTESITWDISEFRLSPDRNRGAFVTNEEGISRLYLFDPVGMRSTRVDRLPLGVISALDFSPDSSKLGMTLNTARTPSDAYVLMLKNDPLKHKRLVRWTRGDNSGLNADRFIQPELIHYPAPMLTDTRTMLVPAFVYKPRGRGPHPVVIYIHGGPEGQFRPSFNSTIQMWLDQLKVAVIAPNVRGSLGYGEHYLRMDDSMLRENSVKDIGALLDWIGQRKEFDQSRVAVYGASYGGYMTLASTVHFGDRIRAAVARSGISNFVTYLENTQSYRRDMRRREYGDERIPEMRAFLQEISPLNHVDEIRTPLLIVQGNNDPVVPVSESQQIVQALSRRGLPVWYMNALNEGHTYERKENRDLFQQVTYLFLSEYLLGAERYRATKN